MIRRVVIVEDETAAAVNLRSMLVAIDESIEIVAVLESVEESVEYFSHAYDADVIFMDIHLADGDSFRIFQRNSERYMRILFRAHRARKMCL